MRNIKLTLAYDGTDFHGWQIQPHQPTIQGHLVEKLSTITQENIVVHGSGRTDAGVHALGQVGNFKTESNLAPSEFQRALNAMLPASIRIPLAEEVSLDFHARHSAVGKTYVYRVFRSPVVWPFQARYVLPYSAPLDESAMMEAARLFEGQHDFTSFSASAELSDEENEESFEPNPIRTIRESGFTRTAPPRDPIFNVLQTVVGHPSESNYELLYRVRGRSFLRFMVRKVVATLIDVGRGRFAPADIPRLLEMRDRSRTPSPAPAQGLFLESVEYRA